MCGFFFSASVIIFSWILLICTKLRFAFILQLRHMFAKVKSTFGTHRNMAEINKLHIWLTIAAVN